MTQSDLQAHQIGFTPWMASRSNRYFCWSLYVPPSLDWEAMAPLLVVVHGTRRNERYRHAFQQFADDTGTVLLAPLFPAASTRHEDLHGYKWLDAGGVRYDLLLLDMIEEAASLWPVDTDRFVLFGFGGGGDFAHRFLYFHPDRLNALCLAAPSRLTLPDAHSCWPRGVADLQEHFDCSFNADAVREVPIHLVVGTEDTELGRAKTDLVDPDYIPGINDGETNRIEKLQFYATALEILGCPVHWEQAEGIAHDGLALVPAICRRLQHAAEPMFAPQNDRTRIQEGLRPEPG